MTKGYYPDYYSRKRRRDIQIFWTGRIIMIVVLIAVGVLAGVYVWNTFWKHSRTEPGVSPGLADERDQLAAASRLDEAVRNAPAAATGDATGTAPVTEPPDLASLPYENSFPLVGVNLANATNEGVVDPDEAAATADAEPATEAAAEPPQPDQPAATEPPKPSHEDPKPAKPETEPKPKEQPKPEDKPADQPAGDVPAATESGAKSFEFRVYAGAFTSKDMADQASKDLSAHGLNGQISFQEPNYTVLVAVLDDFEAAQALQRKVVQSGFPKAYTTKKSKKK